MDYRPALALATTACLEAGALIRAEFHRPGGPRGLTSSHGSHGAKAGIDDEAEKLIRDILSTLAGFAFLGEETTDHDAVVDDADAPSHVWVVDPNDGTSHFLAGERGSAVSIGLLRDGIPVLGAVYSPSYPHDGGDLITWAENLPLTRNGRPVPALLASSEYNNPWSSNSPLAETALVPRSVDSKLQPVNPFLAMPYISLPSIAYRLAKLACGDASVAVSLHGLSPWDVAAGHALVRGAGGTLVDDRGNEVTYTRQGRFRDPGLNKAGAFLAGSKGAVGTLLERRKEFAELKAHMAAKGKKERDEVYRLFPAVRGSLKCVDSTKLSRIQGALVGLLSQADAESGKAIRFARQLIAQKQYLPIPDSQTCAREIAAFLSGLFSSLLETPYPLDLPEPEIRIAMEGRNIVTGNLITGLDSPKHLERAIEFGRRGLESVPPAILRAVQTRREGHEGEWTCDVLEVAEALGFAGGLWSEEEIAQASAIKG